MAKKGKDDEVDDYVEFENIPGTDDYIEFLGEVDDEYGNIPRTNDYVEELGEVDDIGAIVPFDNIGRDDEDDSDSPDHSYMEGSESGSECCDSEESLVDDYEIHEEPDDSSSDEDEENFNLPLQEFDGSKRGLFHIGFEIQRFLVAMDPLGTVFDKLKGFTKSSHEFFAGLIPGHGDRRNSASRNPIEILKRLQREIFSDVMKLRERQDKVERVLSFYKPSSGGPFQEATTHVRGQVDCLGALLVTNNINEEVLDVINQAGIRTGVDSRLIFETNIRGKDTLVVEFVASQKGIDHDTNVLGSPLSLAKLCYIAKVSDWLSVMAIPLGAQCKDIAIASKSFSQHGKGLTDVSSAGPLLLNLQNGSAISMMVRKSNIVASLAQLVSGLGMPLGSNASEKWYSTFSELSCHLPRGTKLSVMGLYQIPLSSTELSKLGPLTFPILTSRQAEPEVPESFYGALPWPGARKRFSTRSVALTLESELDDITKIGGWVEMNRSNLRWGASMADVSEDSFGWGMSFNGIMGDTATGDLFQAESHLKFNLSNKFCLKPGLAYVTSGNSKIFGLMLRSSWSF
ncbi:hypothetical protein K1719_016579 [Acacia pycnantha]|nr:hypothetical protein K1719_016579 [Acacia pycnantha]